MKDIISKFSKIRNIWIKSILAVIGLIVVLSVFYPFILTKFYLTEKEIPTWNTTDWILLSGGFFLSVGGAYYNKIVDGIAGKFSNSQKNGTNE